MSERVYPALDEAALAAWATGLAAALVPGLVLYLYGDLGAGKTTLTRALLRALGWAGPVKSPTYTLVESYALPTLTVHHFDLYRLIDAEELALLGIRDYADGQAVLVIEWPQQGAGFLPPADLELRLDGSGPNRNLQARACSPCGQKALESIQ